MWGLGITKSAAETAPTRETYWDKVLAHELQKLDRILLRQRNKAEDEFYATLKEFEMMNQMEDEPQQSFPKQKPQKEASMPVITSDRRTDVCFVNAFRSLGVHVPYYLGDGPFWALADGTEMLRPFGFLAYM